MKNKKITKLLKSLNKSELGRMGQFLDASYFVMEKTPLAYFQILRDTWVLGSTEPSEEEIFAQLFPGEAYDYRRMSRLNSQMVSLCYRFLAVDFLQKDDLRAWGMVLDSLDQEQREAELLDLTLSAAERALQRAPESAARLHYAYRLLEVQAKRPPDKGRQAPVVDLPQVRGALKKYEELAELRLECVALNRQLALGDPGATHIPEAPEDSDADSSLARLYELVRENLRDPSDLDKLMDLQLGISKAIEKGRTPLTFELKEICQYALNGSIRLVNLNSGAEEPRQLLRGVYQQQLSAGLLLVQETLPSFHFKNMVQNLVLIGEFKEAEQTIGSYANCLSGDYKGNAALFAKGYLAYHKGQFAEALGYFRELLQDYKDLFYGLDGRLMLLRTLYELGDLSHLENVSESFRQFLRRTRTPEIFNKLYSEANRNISRLAKIMLGSPDRKQARKEKFIDEIEGAEKALLREWLLEKARQ